MPLICLNMLGDEALNSLEHARVAIRAGHFVTSLADLAILANSTFLLGTWHYADRQVICFAI